MLIHHILVGEMLYFRTSEDISFENIIVDGMSGMIQNAYHYFLTQPIHLSQWLFLGAIV